MRGSITVAVVVTTLLGGSILTGCRSDAASSKAAPCELRRDVAPDLPAQQALLARLFGCAHANQIRLAIDATPNPTVDRFSISADPREGVSVRVQATSPSAALAGVNWYLDHVVGISVSWSGSRIDLPDRLPSPDRQIDRDTSLTLRVALNDTSSAYTNPFQGWEAWERLIDVLALHGVTAVNLTEGHEATVLATFSRLGFSTDELRAWMPLPPHQPWWVMGNLHGVAPGPSVALIYQRTELAKQVMTRVRELGMEPILPGFSGLVPPGIADRVPGARIVPQGMWNGYDRPDWLDPTSPAFPVVAKTFYEEQARLFGAARLARMDLQHEGGSLGSVPLADAGRAVSGALQLARPGAIWVALGWQGNPGAELIRALGPGEIVVLDGLSDAAIAGDRRSDWPSTSWAFGSVLGFGGRTGIGGNVAVWPERLRLALDRRKGGLTGVAYLPEAASGNPMAFDLFFELPWTDGEVDLTAWSDSWSIRRYGTAAARDVGPLLMDSVYRRHHGGFSQPADSLLTVRPALYVGETVSLAQPLHYQPDVVIDALDVLLALPGSLQRSGAAESDIGDLARQVLADHARVELAGIAGATRRRNVTELRGRHERWLAMIDLAAELAATDSTRMFGTWVRDVRAWGEDDAERAALDRDARTLVTTWGSRATADGGLSDYAGREWSGLLETHYRARWDRFLGDLIAAVGAGAPPPRIDWYPFDAQWAASRITVAEAPTGDVVDVARRVRTFVAASR